LANIVWAYRAGQIGFAGLRVFCGAAEMAAIREAAGRAKKNGARAVLPHFSKIELAKLTGLSRRIVARELGRLKRAGVLRFDSGRIAFTETGIEGSGELREALACHRSPARPIPMPRRVLLFLARTDRPALFLTVIGYAARGLSLDKKRHTMRGKGTVKATWISKWFGVSERATRYARLALVAGGLISKDVGSQQWKLNRDGAYFEFNFAWRAARADSENAGPAPQKRTENAPPYKTDLTSYGSKDQTTAAPAALDAGVWRRPIEKPGHPPSIRQVRAEDLQCFSRVEELYFQACRKGLIKATESSALSFLAAAVRAREANGDAAKIFMGIVRRSLWQHITQHQEDRARSALVRYRADNADRFRLVG
jgi:hypothetical protein